MPYEKLRTLSTDEMLLCEFPHYTVSLISGLCSSTAKLYKILFVINTNSISQRTGKLTFFFAELEMID